jgi:hypothetical protein
MFALEQQSINETNIRDHIALLGEKIRLQLNMPVADLDETQSRFFKDVWVNPPRLESTVREQDTDWDILDL